MFSLTGFLKLRRTLKKRFLTRSALSFSSFQFDLPLHRDPKIRRVKEQGNVSILVYQHA
jgi:hypothetical protein